MLEKHGIESMLTLSEVARLLQVSQRTVYRLAQDGRIPAFKVGQAWRFRLADIEAWIDAQVQGPRTGAVQPQAASTSRTKGVPSR